MESFIFKIGTDGHAIIDKDAMELSPELSKISDKELLFVILVEDYIKSILRRKPKEERIRTAGLMIFNNTDYAPSDKVNKAMDAYHGLIYDPRRETIDTLNMKINQINVEIMKPQLTTAEFQNLIKVSELSQKRIDELNKKIDEEEDEEVLKIKGGKKLSRLEIWQRNKKKFNEYRKQIQV